MKFKVIVILTCLLALHLEAKADEPAQVPNTQAVPAKAIAPSGVPAAVDPGQVYRISDTGKLELIDMTKFYVLAIEWKGPAFGSDFELGLRNDGVVVWRRAAK